MLSTHKKYLIERNKRVLKFLVHEISRGNGVRKSLRKAAETKELNISYGAAAGIFYKKDYPLSPYFEYDNQGRAVFEKDTEGNRILGTETEFYSFYIRNLEVAQETV